MNAKIVVFLILLAAAGGTVAILLNGDREPAPLPSGIESPGPESAGGQTPSAPLSATPRDPETVPDPTPTQRERVEAGAEHVDYVQGATGVVADPGGAPLTGIKVYLMEGSGSDMFRHLQLAQRGAVVPPVASAETDSSGRFRLGVDEASAAKTYEIRIVADSLMDHNIPNVRIAADEWYDAGTIRLQPGHTLFGRVTIKGSPGMPVPNAQVMVKAVSMFPSLTPTPGREDGLTVDVDQTGNYQVQNAPAGVVSVSAIAPGYARIERANVTVHPASPNNIDLELPPGVSIGGRATDAQGHPVANVKVEATAISSTTPVRNSTRSNDDGTFEVPGLIDGNYLLQASAPGYVQAELKPVRAGDMEIQVILEEQCRAQLRVFDKNGGVLRSSYVVTVKRYFEAQKQPGNAVMQPQRARPDRSGLYEVEGLDPETYVFQIDAEGHAKAFSDPFAVALNAEVPLVEVRLNEGGRLAGVVLDQNGRPLAGVQVSSLPNDYEDNPFTKMFAGMIPVKVTKARTTTNARGEYEMNMLNPGTYQLKFTHPEHYDVKVKDNEVLVGEVTRVADLKMQRGTVVTGVARIDGTPSAQVKVTVTAIADPGTPVPGQFTAEAITGNDGKFVFDKRVPPGRYQVMAARQTLQNPLVQIADFHKTKQEFTLAAGQNQFYVEINIPSQ